MRANRYSIVVSLLLAAAFLAGCGATAKPSVSEQREAIPAVAEKVVESAVSEGARAYDAYSPASQIERMIIWNAQIVMVVQDTQEALGQAQSIAHSLGGYTIGSESWREGDQLYARLTVRVPAENYEAAMAQLRDLALEVERESATSEDVTDEYVDLGSRLRHLQAKEKELLGFLDRAEDTEAVLAVYRELASTQAEIEQVKGRMAYLEKLSAMATITVELRPEPAEPPVVEEGWKPLRTVRGAARTLVSTLQVLGNVLIWFVVYVLPILVLLALPVVLLIWLIRWARRRRQKRAVPEGS